MLPNWFVALPVDANVVATLPPVPPGFRAFHPQDVHMTLSFLGACGEQVARTAFSALVSGLHEVGSAAFDVTLGEIVPMGPKGRYSALSAIVNEGNGEAVDFLRQWRDRVADAASVSRDKRAPLPHVTVARPQRRATDEQREVGLRWATSVVLPPDRVRLDRVALYTWSERRLPRLFQIVEAVGLGE